MTSFDTLQSISSRLLELTNQLSTSKLSKEELSEFEMLSRKIYERAVILNYKSKEEKVYGDSSGKIIKEVLPFENDVESTKEEIESDKTHFESEKTENQAEEIEEEIDDIEEEEKIEYDVEDNTEEEIIDATGKSVVNDDEGRVQFDFSGGFGSPKVEEKPKPEPIVQRVGDTEEDEELQIKQENTREELMAHEKESIVEQKTREPLEELLEESDRKLDDSENPFYTHFLKAYKAASGDRLGTSKIPSLKGAIGLNDRLQFINELFNGDSNLYNDTVNQLDQLENNEVALRKLSGIASEQNWNKDDSSVEEFAHFVTRRYVD